MINKLLRYGKQAKLIIYKGDKLQNIYIWQLEVDFVPSSAKTEPFCSFNGVRHAIISSPLGPVGSGPALRLTVGVQQLQPADPTAADTQTYFT